MYSKNLNEIFNENQRNCLLNILLKRQELLKEGEYIRLSEDLIEYFIFEDETKQKIKENFSLKGLDLSNIDFNNIEISGANFKGSRGAKINPQTVKNKDCSYVNFSDVEIIGSFDNCNVIGVNFKEITGMLDVNVIKEYTQKLKK